MSGESGTLTIPDATLTLKDDVDLPTLTLAGDHSSTARRDVAAVTASLTVGVERRDHGDGDGGSRRAGGD